MQIVYQRQRFTPAQFAAAVFQEDWLLHVQEVVRFWLSKAQSIAVKTSGSTGKPKQISISRKVLEHSAKTTLAFLEIREGSLALFLPAAYIGGKMMVVRALIANLDLYLFEPKGSIPALNQKFVLTALTPFQASQSLPVLSVFENIILGGGEVAPKLENALVKLPIVVYNSYAMTETASHLALRKIDGKNRPFIALPGVTFNQDDRGCLIITAPEWEVNNLVTNDRVKLHSATEFDWLGRADNVINSGGVKLHPEQIEKVLTAVISQPFFVASVPDEELGNKLILIVEGEREPLDLDVLEGIQKPKSIAFLESFVYTETGKVNRKKTLALINTA